MEIRGELNFDRTNSLTVESAINSLSNKYPDLTSPSISEPVFVFSAGWRSGSTLVQRLLMSSDQILIWGEPYGRCGMINHLARSLTAITNDYPDPSWFIDKLLDADRPISSLSDKWVANLYPEIEHLLAAHLSFFVNHFEVPAASRGMSRWGIKEVRLTIDSAIYLKWLFPRAKFIFLYRNPYNCYSSYKGFYWYNQYPDDPISTPQRFGQHWKDLLEGFIAGASKVDSIFLKYEDLCEGNVDFAHLESFLGLKLNQQVLENILFSTKKDSLSQDEVRLLSSTVEPMAASLGYSYQG